MVKQRRTPTPTSSNRTKKPKRTRTKTTTKTTKKKKRTKKPKKNTKKTKTAQSPPTAATQVAQLQRQPLVIRGVAHGVRDNIATACVFNTALMTRKWLTEPEFKPTERTIELLLQRGAQEF